MRLLFVDGFSQDLRFAFRGLRRTPGFTLVAIGSLALGIGANTAIFSFVDAILLKHLPVPDPDRLVQLHEFEGSKDVNDAFSYPFLKRLAAHREIFDGLLGRFPVDVNLTMPVAEPLKGEIVTGQYFTTLGVHAALGRLFTEKDVRAAAADPICVISYASWQQRFAGDPKIVGRTVVLNGHPYRVTGVTERGFQSSAPAAGIEVQIPVSRMNDFMGGNFFAGITWDSPAFNWLQPLGRLKPGMTRAQAEAMLQPLARQIKIELADPKYREQVAGERLTLHLLDGSKGFNYARTKFARPITVLMDVVGLILLIACANLANLLLARASARSKEFAVRLSIGASRARLVRQLMVESAAIAVAGGSLGVAISYWITATLLLYLNEGQSVALRVSPDLVVLGFSGLVTIFTALLFGLAPAWQAARTDLVPSLKEAAPGATARRDSALVRKTLIAFQISLSLVLLFAAGLLTRTLAKLETIDLGFRPEQVIALSADPSKAGYSSYLSEQLYDEILDRLHSIPQISAAAVAVVSPLEGSSINLSVEVPGNASKDLQPAINSVSPGYFATLRQPFVAGRDFSARDVKGASRVAIVNQRFVSEYLRNRNPVGVHFKQGGGDVEIIGVVGNAKYQELREGPKPVVYFALKQSQNSGYTLLVRAATPATDVIPTVQRAIHSVDSKIPIYNVRTLRAQVDEGISSERILSFLSVLFGVLATLLCAMGLYGIISYGVSRRKTEIGVRFAIGAQKADVAVLFLREMIALLAIGIGAGIPVALGAARLIGSLLYGLKPNDIPTLAAAVVILSAAGVSATFLPVRRAAAIEPMFALRHE